MKGPFQRSPLCPTLMLDPPRSGTCVLLTSIQEVDHGWYRHNGRGNPSAGHHCLEILGIEKGDRGRSCEEHDVCGEVVEEDTLLRLRMEQILVDGKEETSIACYWVTNGIDRCRVGFLKRHMVKHAWRFDGAIMQVTKVFSADPPQNSK